MRLLSSIWKWWLDLWALGLDSPNLTDSHRWENKIELYRSLKNLS